MRITQKVLDKVNRTLGCNLTLEQLESDNVQIHKIDRSGQEPREIKYNLNLLQALLISGQSKAVDSLLATGYDINSTNADGETALFLCVKLRKILSVNWLLEHGALVDAPNLSNSTPLMVAADLGDLAIARLLIQYNADVNAHNTKGLTAMNFAVQKGACIDAQGALDIAKLLCKNGANLFENVESMKDFNPRGISYEQILALIKQEMDSEASHEDTMPIGLTGELVSTGTE